MIIGEKFGRRYRLTIDPKDGQGEIVIELPFSCQFWVERKLMSSLNHMSIDLYNLGENTRNRLFQDRFTYREKTIVLEVGYENITRVFSGYLFECNSSRNGSDIITRIESLDGNFDVATTITNKTLAKGQTHSDVIKACVADFPNLTVGHIGDYSEELQRPVTLNGNTWNILKDYSGGDVYIDQGEVSCLRKYEVLEGEAVVLDASTGLIGTPRRDDAFLTVQTLMEPLVKVGSIVSLNSTLLPIYNGNYKVLGIRHEAMISNSVGGVARSTFNLLTGAERFKTVPHA